MLPPDILWGNSEIREKCLQFPAKAFIYSRRIQVDWAVAHGGRRAGAGRPAGTGWVPAVTKMRVAAAEKLADIVGTNRDPLTVVIDAAFDEKLDVQTRIGA